MKFSQKQRNDFAGNSSGNSYRFKSDAVEAFNASLPEGVALDPNDLMDWYGNEGRKMVRVIDNTWDADPTADPVGHAMFTWYNRNPTGPGAKAWEIVGYLT